MKSYMPIMLDCAGRVCVVVGGGRVAERKAGELLACCALVTVISPRITPVLKQRHEQGELRWLSRKYAPGDLEGAFMAHAATNDPEVNRSVAEEAAGRGILANVADRPESGNFIHPSVLRRGRLLIAVSASGAGPLAASTIRRKLEEQFGTEYEAYLDCLYEMRKTIKEQVCDPAARQKLLKKASGPDMLDALRRNGFACWSAERIRQWIDDNQEE
ncbi:MULTISPECIES: precorrin-2 dehydrogenase/sirohydrochlorin ferrochelatase family protein [Paenibacillus]|uniref:precorrin-2 dehydrogenase n=1 Tax=Paenibacillus albilobatus TaxID=2716884 RepID=A0A919XL45_9BACL|nr:MULTISPECIES: NAD(P)-dependent oxidoreductase [Paenibacillus]GIO34729.1 siroheme synthase [Paenibacillus albilobatus]